MVPRNPGESEVRALRLRPKAFNLLFHKGPCIARAEGKNPFKIFGDSDGDTFEANETHLPNVEAVLKSAERVAARDLIEQLEGAVDLIGPRPP